MPIILTHFNKILKIMKISMIMNKKMIYNKTKKMIYNTLESIWNDNPGYFSWFNQADFPLYTKNVMSNFVTRMKLKNKFNS